MTHPQPPPNSEFFEEANGRWLFVWCIDAHGVSGYTALDDGDLLVPRVRKLISAVAMQEFAVRRSVLADEQSVDDWEKLAQEATDAISEWWSWGGWE